MEQYKSIQQLLKKEEGQKEFKPVFLTTPIQAVYDGKSGASLESILAQYNSIYLQFQGSVKDTRNIIPMEMRRAGLTITYMDMNSRTITERANSVVHKENDRWSLDSNWSRIDELSLSGDISVSPKGTWIINGKDSGMPAVGPKGDSGEVPILAVKPDSGYIQYTYDGLVWYDIVKLTDITPIVSVGETRTLPGGSKGKVTNVGTPYKPVFEFEVPMGVQGAKGEKGDGWAINGWVDSVSDLPATANVGDTYLVGVSEPYDKYVWKNNTSKWVNIGSVNEVKASIFDGGRADTQYGGTREINCGGADAYLN